MSPKNQAGRPTRRQVVRAGAGLVIAPVILAAGRPPPAQEKTVVPALPNPRDRYPKPPFKKQHQEPPGLACEMDPKPDHGETSYKGSGRLVGRKALVTGGDSGIGRAAAIAFAREGADVAIGYLPAEERDAQDVKKLVEADGRKCLLLPGDIRTEAVCQKLVADAAAGLGGLDLLVNNAAHQVSQASLDKLSTEQLDTTFKTNVYAMVWITKAALPHLPAGGCVINTASVQAFEPSANLLDYAMTKSCMVSFTKSLAKQLAPIGVRVNAVAPGPFWTPLQPSGGQPPDAIVTFGEKSPLGRPGQPAELAGTYVLLAAGDSSYVTGEVFGGTGGTMPY